MLTGPALKQLDQGQVNRGPDTNVDIRTPKERGGNYENDVRQHGIDYSQIRHRWDKQTRQDFEAWAKQQPSAGGSLLDVLLGREPLAAPAPRTAPTIPQPKPPGIKAVSEAVKNQYRTRAHQKPIDKALEAIDAVHDDGILPEIPLKGSAGKALGLYRFTYQGKPVNIAVKSTGPWPALTTIHELGHFIDHQGIDARGSFASVGKGTIAKVIDTIKTSAAYKGLAENRRINLGYYLQPEELWARSYAQYIAVRSNDPDLLKELAAIRKSALPDRQWADEDFEPIAKEIDAAFNKLKWNPRNKKK